MIRIFQKKDICINLYYNLNIKVLQSLQMAFIKIFTIHHGFHGMAEEFN